jgi:two-component system cell cycle sensor histidine kinase/response regulator CckA
MRPNPIQLKSPRARAGARPLVVLVVDDDLVMRELLVTILKFQGHTVLAADSGSTALAMIKTWQGRPIDLLVTDVVMPGLAGGVLANELCYRLPGLKVIFLSGYSVQEVTDRIHPEINTFLPKPVGSERLAEAIHALFAAKDGRASEVFAPVALSMAACA